MRARVLLDHEAVANGVGQTVHAMVEVAAGAPSSTDHVQLAQIGRYGFG